MCKNMQARVVELIPQLEDEGFIEELLMVNDDLNNAFIRYERCVLAPFSRIQGTFLSYRHTFTQTMARNLCSGLSVVLMYIKIMLKIAVFLEFVVVLFITNCCSNIVGLTD